MNKLLPILLIGLMTGCSTSQRAMYVGQGLDLGTTYYALEVDGGYAEANPMADSFEDVLIMKASALVVAEILAYTLPEYKDNIYWSAGIVGAGFGLYNCTQF